MKPVMKIILHMNHFPPCRFSEDKMPFFEIDSYSSILTGIRSCLSTWSRYDDTSQRDLVVSLPLPLSDMSA